MILFWIILALLLAVALLFVVLPLWRNPEKNNRVRRDVANLEIFRDQIAEMDADLRSGLLTPDLYEQGKRELQARLLEDVKPPEGGGNLSPGNTQKTMAIGLAALLTLAAAGLYWKVGNRDALLPQVGHSSADGSGAKSSGAALKELELKLAQNPQDLDNMLLLARSYVELEHYADAAKTYDQLTKLVPNEAQLWAEFADALAMANGQNLAGHPTLLLDRALKLDPDNPKALAMSGFAAMGRGDYPAAIRHWERVLKQVPKNSEDAKMIEDGIRQARELVARGNKPAIAQRKPAAEEKKPATAGSERITGTVTMSVALAGKAKPTDTLFVVARAVEGPKAPLAVIRVLVKDLPLQFVLDDSMAMTPQTKLSNFDRVVVLARVSISGDAIPQPGDLQGASGILKPGSSGVKISIDSVVKTP